MDWKEARSMQSERLELDLTGWGVQIAFLVGVITWGQTWCMMWGDGREQECIRPACRAGDGEDGEDTKQ